MDDVKKVKMQIPGFGPRNPSWLYSWPLRHLLHALVVLSQSSGHSVGCLPVCIRVRSKDIRDICQDRGFPVCPTESSNCCEYGKT